MFLFRYMLYIPLTSWWRWCNTTNVIDSTAAKNCLNVLYGMLRYVTTMEDRVLIITPKNWWFSIPLLQNVTTPNMECKNMWCVLRRRLCNNCTGKSDSVLSQFAQYFCLSFLFQVVSKALSVLSSCMCSSGSGESCSNMWKDSGVMESVTDAIHRKMCDTKWEVRDSALEFIGSLTQHLNKSKCGYCCRSTVFFRYCMMSALDWI